MIQIFVTKYYYNQFPIIKNKFEKIGTVNGEDVFKFVFTNKNDFFECLTYCKLKAKKMKIYKGNTEVGFYKWDN